MPLTVSFMSANFVARELGYRMTEGWGQGEQATEAWFRPLATFEARFDAMLADVTELGFDAIDLWLAHLHFGWATLEHVALARTLLARHKLPVTSYAGGVRGGAPALRATCRLCCELGIPVIGGFVDLVEQDRAAAARILREFGVVYGFENHPETTPEAILARIGPGEEDVIGIAFDTGWCGTNGMDTLGALRRLAPRLKNVHLKDVKARRAEKTGFPMMDLGHETCRTGTGIVPIEGAIGLLRELGYRGTLALEHEPEAFDPREDLRAGLVDVRRWLAAE
jgi:sugar phosphate isomerase/epimerase